MSLYLADLHQHGKFFVESLADAKELFTRVLPDDIRTIPGDDDVIYLVKPENADNEDCAAFAEGTIVKIR